MKKELEDALLKMIHELEDTYGHSFSNDDVRTSSLDDACSFVRVFKEHVLPVIEAAAPEKSQEDKDHEDVIAAMKEIRELKTRIINENDKMVNNTHLPECSDCVRQHERFCSFFEARMTCDYKQYLQRRLEPFAVIQDEDIISAMKEIAELKAKLNKARKALRCYGRHDPDCTVMIAPRICICGLAKAKEEIGK